jgi:hypothetical protein
MTKKKGAITDTLLYFKPDYLPFGLAAPVAFFAAFGAAFLALAFVAIFQMYLAPAIGVGLSPLYIVRNNSMLVQI